MPKGHVAYGGKHGTEISHVCLLDFSCDWDGPRNHNLGGFPKTSERLGRDSQGNDLPAESLESVLKTGGTAPDLLSVGRCRVSAGVSIRAFAGNYSTNDEGFDGGSAFISACEPPTSIRALC